MKKIVVTILSLVLGLLLFAGCKANLGRGETKVELPTEGDFFKLERSGGADGLDEIVEVSYNGEIKFNTQKMQDKALSVSKEKISDMYAMIKEQRYGDLKEELNVDKSSDKNIKETLVLFEKDGTKKISLTERQDTVMPDKWDLWLLKIKTFLGALTGEED
ncbi:MAG: hypothetical protein ACD_63C00054G0006 [uncultured bacterium]|nr:MAG: hypothetical protein ACD_63C00054G0006 [uncultured bacterium]